VKCLRLFHVKEADQKIRHEGTKNTKKGKRLNAQIVGVKIEQRKHWGERTCNVRRSLLLRRSLRRNLFALNPDFFLLHLSFVFFVSSW